MAGPHGAGAGDYAAAGTLAADAGHDVAAAGASAARLVPYDQLSPKDGKVDLDLLRSVGPPVDAAATELEQAAEQVEGLDTTWLIPPLTHRLAGLRDDLRKTVPEARRAADAVALRPRHARAVPAPVTTSSCSPTPPRLGRSEGTSVPTGELAAAAGKLELTRSGRTADLHLPDGPPPEPDPAGFEDRYSRFQPASHLGNVSVSPDFGAVAVESARLYGLALAAHFDGVLYVDPFGLAALLKLTGPITVDGLDEPLTEHNTATFLLLDQYTHFGDRADRFDFLTEASTATFRLLTNAKLPEPRKAFNALYPAVSRGGCASSPSTGRGRPARPGRAQRLVPRCPWRRPDQRAILQRLAQQDRCLRPPIPALRGHGEPGGRHMDALVTVRVDQRAPSTCPPTCWATVTSRRGIRGEAVRSNSSVGVGLLATPVGPGSTGRLGRGRDVAGRRRITRLHNDDDRGRRQHRRAAAAAPRPIQLDGSYQLTVAHQATVNDDDVTVVVHGPDGADLAPQEAFSLTEDRVLSYALGAR